jgi:hypothetical protein
MTGTKIKILQLALMVWLIVLSLSGSAFAWWNDDWTIRKKITLDTTGSAISDPVGTAAILIRLHDGNFQFANGNGCERNAAKCRRRDDRSKQLASFGCGGRGR